MRKITFVILFFLTVFHLSAFCQGDNTVLKNIVVKLQSFYSGHTIEKAYLHFDKPYYIAGDTIYFKAYVTFGEQHELSRQSGVLYADLIGPQNNIYKSIKLQLKDGLAWGDFALPDSLVKGLYKIRAYTQLMRNVNGTAIFEQLIPIGSFNYPSPDSKAIENKADLQFFPEGGDLVYGLNSKVAFKAINTSGLGLSAKGVLIDNDGKVITSFASTHLGMGFFNLTPEEGKTYKADVTFADGTQYTFNLPIPVARGIFFNINNEDPEKLTLGISCNSAFYNQNQNKEFSVIINSGVAVSSASIKLNNPLLAVDLPKKQFRTGVVQFTLFSPEGEPLTERLVFIQQPDLLKLKINSNKTFYNAREKVSVNLNAMNKSDSLVAGHFSVSVIDESKVPVDENKESTILSWLLLSSDLQGYIEEPNYYFSNINKETQANLDVLMLTQGYRRFTWKQLLKDEYPQQVAQPENALQIKGLVTTLQGKPIERGKVNLVSIEGGPMLSQLTDKAGRFDFINLSFPDSARFILKAATEKDRSSTRIRYFVDMPEKVSVKTYQESTDDFDSLMANSLQNRKMQLESMVKFGKITGRLLKEVKIKEIKENSFEAVRVAGTADQLLNRSDIKSHGHLSDCLAGLLLGVTFKGDDFSKLPYLSAPITLGRFTMVKASNGTAGSDKSSSGTMVPSFIGNSPMLIIVDGMKIPPGEGIDAINLEDVEKVEVFKNSSTSIFGAEGGSGVLYITTVKSDGKSESKASAIGILPVTAQGFYKAREFYSPKYESGLTSKQPDLRSTIFWKPELVTDKNGNTSFEYYNGDGPGTYRVVIEGIDDKGNIGRQVYRYKVE
jgi:hypothetical protein